ncbi:MAG TPA: FUSC family protein, partial [Burkholderiaceae bacterium]|nr:FUSC family protein [Burkholderiaceae bacterium]
MATLLLSRIRSLLRNALRVLQDPARRYRHARLIHATRVAFAVLASIVLTTGIKLPHGAWATITVLVVIGGLQHHGNIRRKSAERALGTFIGAAVGLAVIVQQSWLHVPLISYALILAACGVCAYQAIGKGGYVALLSAITIVIVAGHGDNAMADGLWRAVNVLIGTAIALLFSFALPLYATYSWRTKLAEALRACASLYGQIADCGALDRVALQKVMVA